VDIGSVAELCSKYLLEFEKYRNKAYMVTGCENLDFIHVAKRINEISGAGISYKAVSPLDFF